MPDVAQQVQRHFARVRVDGQGEVGGIPHLAADHITHLAQLDFGALAIGFQRIHRVQATAYAVRITGIQFQAVHRAARTIGTMGAGKLGLHGGRRQHGLGDTVVLTIRGIQAFINRVTFQIWRLLCQFCNW